MAAAIAQGRDFFGIVPKQQPDFFPPGHGRPQVGDKGECPIGGAGGVSPVAKMETAIKSGHCQHGAFYCHYLKISSRYQS